MRENSSKMTNCAWMRLSEELFEVWGVEIVQFFVANLTMIVVSGQTLLKNSLWRILPVSSEPYFSYISPLEALWRPYGATGDQLQGEALKRAPPIEVHDGWASPACGLHPTRAGGSSRKIWRRQPSFASCAPVISVCFTFPRYYMATSILSS